MIGNDPYGIRHAVKPWDLPEPLKSVSTHDPQCAVNRCLNCAAPLSLCRGDCKPGQDGPGERPVPSQMRRAHCRDEKIRELIRAGWRNNDAICEELEISKSTLIAAKRRLKERGEIN